MQQLDWIVPALLMLVVMSHAVRSARQQGVSSWPLLGWSLLLACFASGMAVLAAQAPRLFGPRLGLVVLIATLAFTLLVTILLAQRIWRRLRNPP